MEDPKTKTCLSLAVHGGAWTHPATLFLCLLLQERNGCVWSRREGGQRLFCRYDERVKTMIVACFFLPWYQHRPSFCQVSASTSPCQLYVNHVIYHSLCCYLPTTYCYTFTITIASFLAKLFSFFCALSPLTLTLTLTLLYVSIYIFF